MPMMKQTPTEAARQAEEAAIREWLEAYPHASLRWLAEQWGSTASTVMRKLKSYGYECSKSSWTQRYR